MFGKTDPLANHARESCQQPLSWREKLRMTRSLRLEVGSWGGVSGEGKEIGEEEERVLDN